MRLLADENIARQIVARLRSDGHDVLYVKEGAQGSADVDVLATAVRESAVLLTDDQDFGDLVMFQRRSALGVSSFGWKVSRPMSAPRRCLTSFAGMPPSWRGLSRSSSGVRCASANCRAEA